MCLISLLSCVSNVIGKRTNDSCGESDISEKIKDIMIFEQRVERSVKENKHYEVIDYIKKNDSSLLPNIDRIVNILNNTFQDLLEIEETKIYKALNNKVKIKAEEAIRKRYLIFDHSKSLLILSLYANDIDFAKKLINYIEQEKYISGEGLDSVVTVSGKNILHLLADMDFESVSGLLSQISQYVPMLLGQQTNNGECLNPFNYSLRERNTEMADWLLENGADFSLSLVSSSNSLCAASSLDLLMFGMHFENRNSKKKMNKIDDYLLFLKLDEDVNYKEIELAKKIINKAKNSGLDVLNQKTLQLNSTPLISAAIMGSLKLIKLFIDMGSNIFEKDERGFTFLHFMISNVNFSDDVIIEMLEMLGDKENEFINNNSLLEYLIVLKSDKSFFRDKRLKLLKVILEKTNANSAYLLVTRHFTELKSLVNNEMTIEVFNDILEKAKSYKYRILSIEDFIAYEINRDKDFLNSVIEKEDNLRALEALLRNGLFPNIELLTYLFKKLSFIKDEFIAEDIVELRILNLISKNESIYEGENLNILSFLLSNSCFLSKTFMKSIFNNIKHSSKLEDFINNYSFIRGKEENFYFLIEKVKETRYEKFFASNLSASLIKNIKKALILKEDEKVLKGFIEALIEIYGLSILSIKDYDNQLKVLENLSSVLKRYNFVELSENLSAKNGAKFILPENTSLRNKYDTDIYSLDEYGNTSLQKAVNDLRYRDAVEIVEVHFGRTLRRKIVEEIESSLFNKFCNHFVSAKENEEEARSELLKYSAQINNKTAIDRKIRRLKKYLLTFANIKLSSLVGKLDKLDNILISQPNNNDIGFFQKLKDLKEYLNEKDVEEDTIGSISGKVNDFLISYGNGIALIKEIGDLLSYILKHLNNINHLEHPIHLFLYKNNSVSVLETLLSQGRIDVIVEFSNFCSLRGKRSQFNFENLKVKGKKIKEIIKDYREDLVRKKAKRN